MGNSGISVMGDKTVFLLNPPFILCGFPESGAALGENNGLRNHLSEEAIQ